METVLERPSPAVLEAMLEKSKGLAREGIRAITTSCGFNAVFQRELSRVPGVQVFTSSLMQVPLVRRMSGNGAIGVITAKRAALREEHLRAVGIDPGEGILIFGLETCPEWGRIFTDPDLPIDVDKVACEVVDTALRALREHPDISAFVLECTDLPPFSEAIRRATKRPVYDFTTQVALVARALGLVPGLPV